MKFPMPRENSHIRPIDNVWYGEPYYKKALLVPEINFKYGSVLSKIKTMPSYSKYLIGSFYELFKAVKSIERNPYSGKKIMTEQTLAEVNAYAKSLGISGVGYTKVTKKHMFSDSIVLFKNAIVFTMEMKKSKIEIAPSKATNKEVFRTYYELGKAVNYISDFLREMKYNAQPIPAIGSNINLSLMARDAGLGGFGKHGLLITNKYGPSVRLAAVLTDVENLPLSNSEEFDWIKDFCESCNVCVSKCPAGAIYKDPIILNDGSEQHIDFKKCAVPFTKQRGCTVCIKECTFFKANYEKIKNGYLKRKEIKN
jgi:epoxyqueuosine reductase